MTEEGTGDDQRRRAVRASLAGSVADDFRPDVEGLRAVAVIVVVLFHAKFAAFEGGFIGVDVFFVLSGFLITRLLVKELASTGTISLRTFWARRARRLLPASALVVVATLLVGRVVLAPLDQRSLAVDAVAAGAFVANFRFAAVLGDYFGAQLGELTPSPLLHFWSLAVEEQFYLVWPGLMLLVARRPRQYRRLLILVLVGLGLASLLISVWLTSARPTWAFYLLPARMVELIVGALVALAWPTIRALPSVGRAAAGWVGLGLIAVSVLVYDESMAFPGVVAMVPVLATAAVIAAGGSGAPAWAPGRVLGPRPMQWIGRHSYAIYLWHWPALVLAEAELGPLSVAERFVVIGMSVALAYLSHRLVEDPVRHAPAFAASPGRGLALGGALSATVLVAGGLSWATLPSLTGGGEAVAPTLVAVSTAPSNTVDTGAGEGGVAPSSSVSVDTGLGTGGYEALLAANQQVLAAGLATDEVPSNLRPSLATAFDDKSQLYPDGCVNIGVDAELHDCRYGVVGGGSRIVLYGDSHAAHWFPALEAIAAERGAELVVMTKGGCPTAAVRIPTNTLARTCPQWRDRAMARLAELQPDMVLVTAWAGYPNSDDEWRTGLQETLGRIAPHARDLVVLGDNPNTSAVPATCLSEHLTDATRCINRRERAVSPGRITVEGEVAAANSGRFIDTSDWLCTPEACPVILGDILLYRDVTHLTTTGAAWLRPLLEASLFPG
jgi:peptidoglycan/LPS O-acetylase OafA/YrhL